MAADNPYDLLRLIFQRPTLIAHALGFDKLTPLHDGWIRQMVFSEKDTTLQGHRGSYKTTCLAIAFALILVLFPAKRVIFLRKTDDDVAEVMVAVANILKSPIMRAISLKLHGVEVELIRSTNSVVETNLKQGVSGAPQLLGLGCGASLTGKHADLIFTDDIINVKDRVSGAERRRICLVYQELQNIRNRGGRIFNTGTPWHKDDAFRLMPNIVRYPCRETGLMTPEEIETVRRSMSPSLFAANYELKHIADEDALFATEPERFSDPSKIHDGIGHIDAAYGGADGTAFTAIKREGDDYWCYVRLFQGHVDKHLSEIVALAENLRIGTIYMEKNADKGYLKRDVIALGHPAASYTESQNKHIKISTHLYNAWPHVHLLDCPDFPEDGEAISQVMDYTEHAEHDDVPDSMASIIRKLSKESGIKGWKGGI